MYRYEDLKKNVFTEEGQEDFLQIRDKSKELLKKAGAFTLGSVISDVTGDSWTHIACVDRLVELGEIKEIEQGNVAGQHRIFVKKE